MRKKIIMFALLACCGVLAFGLLRPTQAAAAVNGVAFLDTFQGIDSAKWTTESGDGSIELQGDNRFYSLRYDGAGGASAIVATATLPATFTATVRLIADSEGIAIGMTDATGYNDIAAGALAPIPGTGELTAVYAVELGAYTLTVNDGAQSSGSVTGGKLALVFGATAAGNVLDITVRNADGKVVLSDTFTSDKTVAPLFAADPVGYVWRSYSALAGRSLATEKTLHVVSTNELIVRDAGWPTEIAYTGYTLQGGVGARYTIDMQIMLVNSGPSGEWLGFINNTQTVAPGVRAINNNTLRPGVYGGFVDRTTKTIFGDMEYTGSAPYEVNRKTDVRIELEQTGENATTVTIGFRYADAQETAYTQTVFYYKNPIGGYVGFSMSRTVVFYGLSITADDGTRHVAPFGEMNSTDLAGESFFVGLKQDAKFEVVDNGLAESGDGSVVFAETTAHGATLRTTYAVPARTGVDTREMMYAATLELSKVELSDANGIDLLLGEGENFVRVKRDGLELYRDGALLTKANATIADDSTLTVETFADGRVKVAFDETTLEGAGFNESDFVGSPGIRVYNPDSRPMRVCPKRFSILISGIPTVPTLGIAAFRYVAVGQPYNLKPIAMSDELDEASALTLHITVTDPQEKETVLKDGITQYTFAAPGYYTVSYRLTNTHELFAEKSMTVRAIYRGDDSAAIDKLDDPFDGADSVTTDGTVTGGTVRLSGGNTLYTKGTVSTFMLYLDVQSVDGAFEIVFGNSHGYEYAFGILFDNGAITGRNLTLKAGGSYDSEIAAPLTIKLTVIGGTATVALRAAETPFDNLYKSVATFAFSDDMPAGYGSVGIAAKEGATVVLDRMRIFSLAPNIDIDTEPYVPAPERVRPNRKKSGNVGLIVGLSVGGGVLLIGGAAAVTVILSMRRKKRV